MPDIQDVDDTELAGHDYGEADGHHERAESQKLSRPAPQPAKGLRKGALLSSNSQATINRGTPESIKRDIRKLTRVAGPLEYRKRALYALATALVDVADERRAVEVCAAGDFVSLLCDLLRDAEAADHGATQREQQVKAGLASADLKKRKQATLLVERDRERTTIKISGRELQMTAIDTRLYVLSCLVNLISIGGGRLLFERSGLGMDVLVSAVLEPPLATGAQEAEAASERAKMEPLLYYAVAGLYNLSNSEKFAEAAAAKPGLHERLSELTRSSNSHVAKYAAGAIKQGA